MNLQEFFKAGIWGTIGSIISMTILYFRFRNPLLRKELILFMQDGDVSYWFMFIILDVFLLLILLGFYYYNIKKQRGKKK